MTQRNLLETPAADVAAPAAQPALVPAQDALTLMLNHYKAADDAARQSLLAIMSDYVKNILYQHYLDDLDADIRRLEDAHNPASDLARAMHAKLAAARRDNYFRLSDSTLFDALHKTNMLVKTPVVGQDNNINPDFTRRSIEYTASMDKIRKESRSCFGMGLCYALGGALMLAGIAVVFVLTFGKVLPNPDVTMNMVVAGMGGLMTAMQIPPAIKYFTFFKKEKALADTMQPLIPALREGNGGPRV